MRSDDQAPPRVSVLIGCWNNADTLGKAIESILAQTVGDLELIVVDDGSTDETPQLVEDFQGADPRVRYLPLPRTGISGSLNAGLHAARANFVAFQDADDWSLPTRLARELEVLERDPDVVVVGCRMREVDERGVELTPRTSFAAGRVNHVLMSFNPVPNSCAMVRRAVVLEIGGFDTRYRYAMDYDLWLRLSERGSVETLDELLAVRRMSGTNVAARKERAQIAETIRLRLSAIRRRQSVRGAHGLLPAMVSVATPLAVKRAVRRSRGQAP
jgi:glycosyltransferase involved in cell wall biosynthesis